MALVSVVLPVFNGERYVAQAIDSILRQTYQQIELIIVDDGSTDSTLAVCEKAVGKDDRVTILRQVNKGSASARNYGVSQAQGDFIALLDADDTSVPERIERQVNFMMAHSSLAAVSCLAYYINDRNEVIGRVYSDLTSPDTAREYVNTGRIIFCLQSGVLIKRGIFNALGGYRSELLYGQDTELWNRLVEHGHSIMVMPEFLVYYRVHRASSMTHFKNRLAYSNWLIANIHRRRKGENELTFQEFKIQESRAPWGKKIARSIGNYGVHFYRTAGLMYGEKRMPQFALYLLLAFLLKPLYTVNKLLRQR